MTTATLYLSFYKNGSSPGIPYGANFYSVNATGQEQKPGGCVTSTTGTPVAATDLSGPNGASWKYNANSAGALAATSTNPPLQLNFPYTSTSPTTLDVYFAHTSSASNPGTASAAFTPSFTTSTTITSFLIYYNDGQGGYTELIPPPPNTINSPLAIGSTGWNIELTLNNFAASQTGGYIISQPAPATPTNITFPCVRLQLISESPIESFSIGPSTTSLAVQLLTPWPQAAFPSPPPFAPSPPSCPTTPVTPFNSKDCSTCFTGAYFLNGEITDPATKGPVGSASRRFDSLQNYSAKLCPPSSAPSSALAAKSLPIIKSAAAYSRKPSS
jgi:hypothetical protein